MRCKNCGMSKNLVKLNLKCLDKGVVAYYCIRCGNVQLELTEQYKKQLIKKLSNKEMKKAIEAVIKEAN